MKYKYEYIKTKVGLKMRQLMKEKNPNNYRVSTKRNDHYLWHELCWSDTNTQTDSPMGLDPLPVKTWI